MSTREKIIVICALLAVVYGAYSFFPRTSPPVPVGNSETKSEELNKFVLEVAGKLANKDFSNFDNYILEQAAGQWKEDPFLASGLSVESEPPVVKAEKLARELSLTYSGYLIMGNKILAIINGMEYEVGEALAGHGECIVRNISPLETEIGIKGSKEKIIIPIEEN
ncbi:hypothetical protein [Desulfonema magnum]|uniref:Uncharacterized protein n=1 Tax=Desulfonema magnum TaxID=45655 RepID=A0A975BK44_9BACT|nr:hypothetical protein [Desulfonema magnum]QTA86856.1 Uncharacterized protein dnm_028800 [Desulfonema magnum]